MPGTPAATGAKHFHPHIAFAFAAAPTTYGSGVAYVLGSHHVISYWWLVLTLCWAVIPLAVFLGLQRYARAMRTA
jgi:hypothetical protein